ncbi:MAG: hypothetical protein R3320_13340 [Nitriliruptorales bacterium]|nr:hypothetical protein [Nitriliruptorales bacterium]
MKSRRKLRVPITLLFATTMMVSAGYAFAQSTPTVTTSVTSSSRIMSVTDLAGSTLTELSLSPGEPKPFKVSVTDTNIAASDGFNVQSKLNDLYFKTSTTSYDFTRSIASSDVGVSYPSTPLTALGTTVDLDPDYLLNGEVTCDAVLAALGSTDLSADSLTDPLCSLLGGLLANGGGTTTVTDVLLDQTTTIPSIDLGALLPSQLPIGVGTGTADVYADPDCSTGTIGAGQCDNTTTPATTRDYMIGTPITSVVDPLLSELTNSLTTGPLVSADGSAAIASAEDVVLALQGASSTAVQDVGNTLTEYVVADQVAIINAVLTETLTSIVPADLSNVAGTYNSFPQLTVNPSGTPDPGDYAGTLTITLVD